MQQWPFVIGAYALTFAGTFLLSVQCWRAMRSAEADAQRLSERS
ncbi:hypothetical protein [Sphingobium mellinum]